MRERKTVEAKSRIEGLSQEISQKKFVVSFRNAIFKGVEKEYVKQREDELERDRIHKEWLVTIAKMHLVHTLAKRFRVKIITSLT